MSSDADCPFCARIARGEVDRTLKGAVAFPDGFPLADGHALVLPERHVPDFFDLPPGEQAAVWALVAAVQADLRGRLAPDGFNIGLNCGGAAGQTVAHAHVHVIPRFAGDVPDPRGGVRWVLPERAAYWDG